ncbi:MAG: putative porin [Bacteroidota bacterium]
MVRPHAEKSSMYNRSDILQRIRALGVVVGLVLGFTATGWTQQLATATDSVVIDTTLKMREVEPRTTVIDPVALSQNRKARRKITFRLEDLIYPDLLLREEGFSNTLGQIGKPYRRFRYGVDASLLGNSHFHNPFTGQENVYMINAMSEVPYFDTRTPFINAYYGQGKADLAQLRVDVAQNITPFLNVGIMYYRRNSTGVYSGFATDQNNLGVTSNFRTRNDRYHVVGNFLFQEHNEEINGGVSQDFTDYNDFFNKGSQPVGLSDALLLRVQRSYYVRQFFRITGDTTDNPHTLRIYNGGQYQQFENEFTDSLIDENIQSWQFAVYPTLYEDAFIADSSFIWDKFASRMGRYDMGLAYSFDKKWLVTHQEGGFQYELMNFDKNLTNYVQTKFTLYWNGDIYYDTKPFGLAVDWRLRQSTNRLFRGENFIDAGARLDLLPEKVDYSYKEPNEFIPNDTTVIVKSHRPLSFGLRFLRNDRNPTLQQAFGEGFQNITFEGTSTQQNPVLNHVRAEIEWRGKARYFPEVGETPGNYLRIAAFRSRENRMIWFDSTMTIQQLAPGTFWQWQGIEASLRLRFLKYFYLENTTVIQQSASNDSTIFNQRSFLQPWFYGRARLFFENKDLSFTAVLRIGVEYFYHLDFEAPLFDPVSQQFYPQTETITPGYHRFDAFAGTQVKRAFLYVKLMHFNENLILPGYFTTQLYPMRDINFVIGVNWSFID